MYDIFAIKKQTVEHQSLNHSLSCFLLPFCTVFVLRGVRVVRIVSSGNAILLGLRVGRGSCCKDCFICECYIVRFTCWEGFVL